MKWERAGGRCLESGLKAREEAVVVNKLYAQLFSGPQGRWRGKPERG